jgi:hypothetical protein
MLILKNYRIIEIMFKGQSKFFQKGKDICKGIVNFFLAVLVLCLACLYYQTDIFTFSEPTGFSGCDFYNPYQNWNKDKVAKANFHAHAKAWKGLTNGHNNPEEIKKQYQQLGFKVAAISNYHHLDNSPNQATLISIPCYEHGFNISKTHLLAIGAIGVDNVDFPLGQSLSQKQTRIQNIKKTAALVALTHPELRNGYSKNDIKYLKGYDLMEVLSPYGEAFELWDYALRQGNVSWILANDDTHDLEKQPAGSFFNLISSDSFSKYGILKALKIGNHVAFSAKNGAMDVFLDRISLKQNKLIYRFSGEIKRVKLIRNGLVFGADAQGVIELDETDKFVRFEVEGENAILYTNPIYREGSKSLASISTPAIKVNYLKTYLFRLWVLFVGSFLLVLIFRRSIPRPKLSV